MRTQLPALILTALMILSAVPAARGQSIPQIGFQEGNTAVGVGPIVEDPREVRRQMASRCEHYLARAREALTEGKLVPIRRNIDSAASLAVTPALRAEVLVLMRDFDELGAGLIERADRQYAQGDFLVAIRTYQVVSASLGTLPTGRRAQNRLDAAEKDPAVRSAVLETKAAALYQTFDGLLQAQWLAEQPTATAPAEPADTEPLAQADLLAIQVEPLEAGWTADADPLDGQADRPAATELVRHMPLERQVRAVELLSKLVELYPDTPTASRASGLLTDLQADASLMQAVQAHRQDRLVRGLYEKARLYHANGLHEKAAELYEQFLAEHPQSPWSDQARRELSEARAKIRPKAGSSR